ncbi:MAG: isoprenylcysteine carboxylmethyltransferase family protein [Acidobacteriota bacterium]
MIDSRGWFTLVVLAVALERLFELRLSRRHESALRARGGFEVGQSHYPWMVALHSSFLAAGPLEVWLLDRPFRPTLALVAGLAVAAAMGLRYWTVRTLGERWTTRVLVVPGEPLVAGGPFRYLRHPNYLAVVIEIAALPLIHGAWLTALGWSLANLFLLRTRIRVEEQALAETRLPEGAAR